MLSPRREATCADDVEPQLHALGRGPCRIGIGKSVRPGRRPQRLAQQIEAAEIAAGIVRNARQQPPGRDQEFVRAAHLGQRRLPGLVGIHQRHRQRLEVAVGFAEHVLQPRHQRRRRIVGDEMAGEFGGDEFRGRGMARDIGQRRFALRDAVVLIDLAEQPLRPRLMRIGIEHEAAGRAELSLPPGKGPAGDDARQRGDVVLRIAAADAERMQLHDFAREIFVQAALAVFAGARVRPERLLVVEKEQHRRMLLDRLAACRRSARAHAAGSPRARTSRPTSAPARPCWRRCRNDWTRTPPAARRIRNRRSTARCSRASASARKVFWMMLSGGGARLRRIGLHRFGRRHRLRWRRLVRAAIAGAFPACPAFPRDLRGDAVERQVAPLRVSPPRLRRLASGAGAAGFRGGVARLLDLELIGEHRLPQRRRRQQARALPATRRWGGSVRL